MNRSTFRFWLVAFGVVLLAAAWQGAGRAEEESRRFKMTITSQMTMTVEGQKQEIIADTTLAYVNKRRGREVSVQFEEVFVKASNNGQELMNTTMNATGVTNVKGGQTKEVRAAITDMGARYPGVAFDFHPLTRLAVAQRLANRNAARFGLAGRRGKY